MHQTRLGGRQHRSEDAQDRPRRILVIHSDARRRARLGELLTATSSSTVEVDQTETWDERTDSKPGDSAPDCVVFGVDPPAPGCVETIEASRRAGTDGELPVVVVAGENDADLRRAVLRAGAQEFVVGSALTAERLAEAVETAIDREEATRKLRASEQLNECLMETTADCVKIFDPDGRILSVSPSGLRLMEVEEFSPALWAEWTSTWPETTQRRLKSGIERARAGQVSRFEAFCPSFKGTPRWFDVTVSPVRSFAGGPITRLLVLSRDITGHKQVEIELAERTALLRNAPVGVCLVNRDLRFVHVNETLAAINGVPVEDHIGRTVEEIVPQLWPSLELQYRRALAGEVLVNEAVTGETNAAPSKRRYWWASYYPVWVKEAVIGIGVIVLETTALKRAEQALRESEARFRAVVESTSQASWEANAEGQVVVDSPAWRAYTGQTVDEWLGQGWIDAVHPDDREAILRQWHDAVESERVLNAEYRIKSPDGGWRWTNVRAAPLRNTTGAITKWVGMNLDITSRKAVEEALREADRRKDEFLAMLGHELRNPLAAIRNAAEILELTTIEDPRLQRIRGVLQRQSSHMTRLIDGLLEVSRVARGKIVLERELVDLRSVVEEVLRDTDDELMSRHFELKVDAASEPVWVSGDSVRLTQVVDNLVGNAIKFTGEQGRITVTVRRKGKFAAVTVQDTGVGIQPNMLSKIFEPFHQETKDIARAAGGLGLGLALVKALVELHEGTVEAHSAGPGRGAEFVVRLPLASPPTTAPEPERRPRPQAHRILIVEDNADAAQMLRTILEARDHDVRCAGTGPEALEALRRGEADIVLCDLGLPGMSGYDVARAVRDEEAFRDITLIAVTGYGQTDDRERTRQAGFDDHLTKPVDLRALDAALARHRGGRDGPAKPDALSTRSRSER